MTVPPIRVLFTIPNFKTAGGGQVLVDICEHLDRALVEPTVCVSEAGGALEARLAEIGVPVLEAAFTVPPRPVQTLLPRCWKASRALAGVHADIWHSWHYIDDYTEPIIARMAGTRRWIYTKKSMFWGGGDNGRGWQARTALATAIVATNSDMVDRFFSSPLLRHRTHVIPIGVSPAYGRATPTDLTALAGVPPGASVVTTVARVKRGKSLDVVVRAMTEVPGAHLLLAGRNDDDEFLSELMALIVKRGLSERVHLLGHVGDVPGLLAATDVFVLPSGRDAEGCPVSMLEAMAAGLPCVAADTPGSCDVVADGRTGVIVPVGDDAAFGHAIAGLLADPERRDRFGAAGRARVERDFSLEREARAHEQLYQRLMGR